MRVKTLMNGPLCTHFIIVTVRRGVLSVRRADVRDDLRLVDVQPARGDHQVLERKASGGAHRLFTERNLGRDGGARRVDS